VDHFLGYFLLKLVCLVISACLIGSVDCDLGLAGFLSFMFI
jgi:hypothetical protein